VSYRYKGETFYTVTPIPFYYKRRALLLDLVKPFLTDAAVESVCDFGCGDGWYLTYFGNIFPEKKYFGVDISKSMVECAKQAAPFARLHISETGIDFSDKFDIIYAIAVFAHVKDNMTGDLFANIYEHLNPGSLFILFEQTGPKRREGSTWCRRSTFEYTEFAKSVGFEIEQRRLIALPVHRFFEKKLAPLFIRLFVNGSDGHSRSINANKSYIFKLLSAVALNFTQQPVRSDDGRYEGNTFYVFKRP
jgi:trans-aconitate methyltransferase